LRTCRECGEDYAREGLERSRASIDCSFLFASPVHKPDLLPSDVTGVNVFNQPLERVRVLSARPRLHEPAARRRDQPGVAQDAGQRCSSACRRTRSLSTATSYELARPSLVLATQNPVEYEGTYPAAGGAARPLHDAARDRLSAALGRSSHADGTTTVDPPLETLEAVATGGEVLELMDQARAISRRGERQPLRGRAPASDAAGRTRPLRGRRCPRAGIRTTTPGSQRRRRSLPAGEFVEPDGREGGWPSLCCAPLDSSQPRPATGGVTPGE